MMYTVPWWKLPSFPLNLLFSWYFPTFFCRPWNVQFCKKLIFCIESRGAEADNISWTTDKTGFVFIGYVTNAFIDQRTLTCFFFLFPPYSDDPASPVHLYPPESDESIFGFRQTKPSVNRITQVLHSNRGIKTKTERHWNGKDCTYYAICIPIGAWMTLFVLNENLYESNISPTCRFGLIPRISARAGRRADEKIGHNV